MRATSGSVGITLTPKAVLSPIGSSFVDFNVYNNEGTVAIVPYAVAPEETAVTYREVFNNGTGAAINFPALGWKHLMSACFTPMNTLATCR